MDKFSNWFFFISWCKSFQTQFTKAKWENNVRGTWICCNCSECKILILIKYWPASLKRTRGYCLQDLLCLIEKGLGLYVSASILVFVLSSFTILHWLRYHEKMYQQHYLKVFQHYIKKGTNECRTKECGSNE